MPASGSGEAPGTAPRSRPKEECTQRSLRMTRPLCPPKSRAPTSCSLRGPLAIWVRVLAGVRLQLLHYPSPQCPPSLPTLTGFECHLGGDSAQPHPHPRISTRRVVQTTYQCVPNPTPHAHLRASPELTSCWPHHLPDPFCHSNPATACRCSLGLCTGSPLTHLGSWVCGPSVPRAGHEPREQGSVRGPPSPRACVLSQVLSRCIF